MKTQRKSELVIVAIIILITALSLVEIVKGVVALDRRAKVKELTHVNELITKSFLEQYEWQKTEMPFNKDSIQNGLHHLRGMRNAQEIIEKRIEELNK